MKYIKRPIPVDISEQWWKDGDHPNVKPSSEARCMWANTSWYRQTPLEHEDGYCLHCGRAVHKHGWIGTLEGGHVVCPGDRIVTGVKGEQYPIKPDIFQQTYQSVNDRPKIICLCGSSRFIESFAVLAWEFEKQGIIALGLHLLPASYPTKVTDHIAEAEGVTDILNNLHLRKIDMADEVFVVNVNGYIGDDTKREIAYANSLGKPVRYLEEIAP